MEIISLLLIFIAYIIFSTEVNGLTWKSLIAPSLMFAVSISNIIKATDLSFNSLFLIFVSLYLLVTVALSLFTTKYKIEIAHSLILILPLMLITPTYKYLVIFLIPLFVRHFKVDKLSLSLITIASVLTLIDLVSDHSVAIIFSLLLLIGVAYRCLKPIEASIWSFVFFISFPFVGPELFWILLASILFFALRAIYDSKFFKNWYVIQIITLCLVGLLIDSGSPMNFVVSEMTIFIPLLIFITINHLESLKLISNHSYKSLAVVGLLSSVVIYNTDLYLIYLEQTGALKLACIVAIMLPVLAVIRSREVEYV